jgi:hypothetical protein
VSILGDGQAINTPSHGTAQKAPKCGSVMCGAFAELLDEAIRYVMSLCVYVSMNKSALTGLIFITFYISVFF